MILVPPQLGADDRGIARKQQADLQVPRGDERAVHDEGRTGIAAHGVDGDAHAGYSSTARTWRPR